MLKQHLIQNQQRFSEEVSRWVNQSVSPVNEEWSIGHFVMFIRQVNWADDNYETRRQIRIAELLVQRNPSWRQIVVNAKKYYFVA